MPFTQSPIEASIWTTFVGLQQAIVEGLIMTAAFKLVVVTWLGFVLMRGLYEMTASGQPGVALGRVGMALIFSALGFGILRSKNTSDFRPVNARGAPWTESSKVKASGRYDALGQAPRGLAVYVQTHRAVAQIGSYVSDQVARLFDNQRHNQSPFLFLKAMAETAGSTIDDPKTLSGLNWLFENCADRREAPILGPTSSYGNLFELDRADCRERYGELRRDLTAWARHRWGTGAFDTLPIAIGQVGAMLGVGDEETLQNKMIASALVNMARSRMGQNVDNVNTQALLAQKGSAPLAGSAATFFTGLTNALTPAGMANGLLYRLTGTDFLAADARNKSAALYNRIVQYIPPIRGYAKGLLALAFVFAAGGLCFGTPRFVVAWLGMLVLFTAYEPLSVILYETTMLFTRAQETADAMAALKSDPLVLAGAAIIDDNLARIQAVYFTLQMGLAAVCGAGGISLFVFSKKIGGGLSDVIVAKAFSMVRMAKDLRSGGR